MDDTSCRQFFSQPTHPYQRQYEALRAVFVEGQAQKEIVEQFGFRYSSLRQLVYEFRQHCNSSAAPSPFFENGKSDARLRRRSPQRRKRLPRKRFPRSPIAARWSCRLPSRCG